MLINKGMADKLHTLTVVDLRSVQLQQIYVSTALVVVT